MFEIAGRAQSTAWLGRCKAERRADVASLDVLAGQGDTGQHYFRRRI